jgi:hypothetical protein
MADSLSSVNKQRKRAQQQILSEADRHQERLTKPLAKPLRTGKTKATREAKEAIAKQSQTEAAALAEADDEIARRKAVAGSKRAGRGSLIRSTGSGTATNLGGTA